LAGEGRYETREEYLARVWADIELMSLELRRLGIEPVDFAAPYGQMNEDLERLLLEAGYRYLYVEGYRLNYPGQHFVYRVDGGTTADQFLNALRLAGQTPKLPPKLQNRLKN
jgi:peptidoglycan/xylan/chitin deacetylase (PgdA/CDA1 family)